MKYTYKDVLKSYSSQKKKSDKNNHLFLYYIYRPMSFPFTWWVLNMGIKANHITFFSILLSFLIPFLLMNQAIELKYFAAVLMFMYLILDCVDGNIARVQRSESKLGEYLDSLAGVLFLALVFPFIGLGSPAERVYFNFLIPILPFIGFTNVILYITSRFLSQKAKSLKGEMPNISGNQFSTPFSLIKSFYDLIPILYAFALYLSILDVLLLVYIAYSLIAFIYIIYKSYKQLKLY